VHGESVPRPLKERNRIPVGFLNGGFRAVVASTR
jgi:hypothetical protein